MNVINQDIETSECSFDYPKQKKANKIHLIIEKMSKIKNKEEMFIEMIKLKRIKAIDTIINFIKSKKYLN
jgi:hypothetical protein